MGRWLSTVCLCLAALVMSGCGAVVPIVDNPFLIRPEVNTKPDNPLFVPLNPTCEAYDKIFETVLNVLDDYFEISYAARNDGRIETFPRTAPGYEQFWRVGNPGFRNRALATIQSMRNRAIVLIRPADCGGYFITVTVFKELEDLPRPTRMSAGGATFFYPSTVERQNEVISIGSYDSNWIRLGTNPEYEQLIIERLRSQL